MTRREARVLCMQILYNADFSEISIDESLKNVVEGEVSPMVEDFLKLVKDNLEKIDSIIEASLVNYTLSRLNKVDKAIIRLATAEMLDGKTPKKIIINEALEITKEYSDQGDHKATSFNNRLLENISKNLN
ncbi:NusB antitermination factor [Anaeroplasma bactoclasticum]|jgi:N utilization substance protein B|uniref:Transcription antitermination protein NusB n=1 Tax=Anaeroplasma bactoclasticum TaxID=2088 RepID=A0A397RVT9_9MOLU|nr:transcription antitermination factor NusB [Anaeroplasma bactoclasticum]RIA77828.1 NusB antitermination factor [Anaeroplasma bactoclasticum]